MREWELRDARAADIEQIHAIYAESVRKGTATFDLVPPEVAQMRARIADIQASGLPYVVAARDARVLGYAYCSEYRPRPGYRFTVEDSVYVSPDAQRQGIGRALLLEVVARAEARGVRQMIAVIGDSANTASIELHRVCGFEMTGTFHAVGWKFERWLDTVLMQRALGPGSAAPPR
jgi:phosphinothricin acetyltransferase